MHYRRRGLIYYERLGINMTLAIGLFLGLIIAIIRVYKVPVLSQISVAFVSVIRGTPILVQLYVTYFGIIRSVVYGQKRN